MAPVFNDLNHGCKGLLLTTVGALNANTADYVIAGGWVPVLSDPNHPSLSHPGTHDVDVLLMGELSSVQSAARALLAANFRPSAKHEFQLLRNACVLTQEFVFNVDLMHPHEGDRKPEMYNDIFDLGVNDAYDPRGSRHMKSIAFKSAAIVYEQNLFGRIPVEGTNLDGVWVTLDIPILSPSAAIMSKCESASIPKRTRDAFDIYFILTGTDGARHAAELRNLSNQFTQVAEQLEHLSKFLTDEPCRYNSNVALHARREIPAAAEETKALLFGG